MKNIKRITAVVLCVLMLGISSATAFATSGYGSVSKDENVYIILNPDGTIKEQIVSCWIHSDDGLKGVNDKSFLNDITNVKSAVKPDIDGNRIQWNTDGTDIYYNGTIEKTPPISAIINYTLDGKKIEAKNLIGKTGNVSINIKLVNNQKETKIVNGQSRTIYTPFAAAIVVDLPNNIFFGVKAEDSQIITDSNNQIVNFLALPGLMENFDVILDDTLSDLKSNLKNEFTITANVEDFEMPSIVIASTTSLVELKDMNINDKVTLLSDGMDELESASDQLEEGVGLLSDALDELDGKMGNLEDGYEAFNKAIKNALDGSNKLVNGTDQLKNASALLKNKVTGELIPGLTGSCALQQQLADKMQTLETQLVTIELPDLSSIQAQLATAVSTVCDMSSDATIQILTGQTFEKLTAEQQAMITAARNQIKENARTQIAQMMASLDMSNLENLKVTLAEIKSLFTELMGSMKLLTDSLYSPDDDISNPQTMANAIIALSIGANDLYEGASDLKRGIYNLGGASDSIEANIQAFKQATNELSDKSGELDKGMGKFADEGLGELYDSNIIDDLNTAVAIKDEMQKQTSEYNSYSGSPEGADTTVRFIMKIDDIEIQQPTQDMPIVEKEEPNFWQRIGNFFVNLF